MGVEKIQLARRPQCIVKRYYHKFFSAVGPQAYQSGMKVSHHQSQHHKYSPVGQSVVSSGPVGSPGQSLAVHRGAQLSQLQRQALQQQLKLNQQVAEGRLIDQNSPGISAAAYTYMSVSCLIDKHYVV